MQTQSPLLSTSWCQRWGSGLAVCMTKHAEVTCALWIVASRASSDFAASEGSAFLLFHPRFSPGCVIPHPASCKKSLERQMQREILEKIAVQCTAWRRMHASVAPNKNLKNNFTAIRPKLANNFANHDAFVTLTRQVKCKIQYHRARIQREEDSQKGKVKTLQVNFFEDFKLRISCRESLEGTDC